jgi:hypothetical protein
MLERSSSAMPALNPAKQQRKRRRDRGCEQKVIEACISL